MKKLQLSETINAPKERVWQILWDKATYPKWTSVFSEDSRMETDWKEGGKVHFLGTDGAGMYSSLEKCIPNEFVSFRHIGEIKNGQEQPVSGEAKKWSGITENYSVKESGGQTVLTVEFDANEESEDYFQSTFPKALAKVKELAEQK